MRQKFRKNVKGTVLLTVLCFTTMCMVIAAVALKVASKSNEDSTKNVMKAQAQITAENYLQQYLSTFPTATGTDGKSRVNYDDLKKIAGANADTPAKITISIQPSTGTTTSTNVSTGTLSQTAVYGGNCTIYVYKTGADGIVVRSEADYNGQSGVASAYFYGQTPTNDLNKNALEVCGKFDVENDNDVKGDVLIDGTNEKDTVRFHNSKLGYYSNFYTNGNLTQHSNGVKFRDTMQENAPTITVGGILYVWQLDIATKIGKTDTNGNTRLRTSTPGTTYNRTSLLNRNGYINVFNKAVFYLGKSGIRIGSKDDDIDVYSYGTIIGKMPTTGYGNYNDTNVKTFFDSARALMDDTNTASNDWDGSADKEDTLGRNFDDTSSDNSKKRDGGSWFYGNFYCYKVGSTMNTDGDFYKDTQNTVIIHGDLCVQGDIWIQNGPLKVTGKVVCLGEVHGIDKLMHANGTKFTESEILKNWPSELRAEQPDKGYAPGLYVYGEKDNPRITSPKTYAENCSNCALYADDSAKSKNFKKNFAEALKYGLGDSEGTVKVSPDYVDDQHISDTVITIQHSCVLNEDEVGCGYNNSAAPNARGGKYYVDTSAGDIWILLPANKGTATKINARFMVTNNNTKHHCYLVFYSPSGVTISNEGKVNTSSINVEKAAAFYIEKYDPNDPTKVIEENATSNFVWESYDSNNKMTVGTEAFCNDWDATSESKFNTTATTNIVIFVPDNSTFHIGSGSFPQIFNAVFYGPKASFMAHLNVQTRVYGQIKAGIYEADECSGTLQSLQYCELEQDSVLHAWLTQNAAKTGTLNLQYYIKAK